jgi:hypothetical protein
LYEIGLDGTGLVQLTKDPYWSDLEPTYLADGDVVFASDRSGRSSECGKFSADHTVVNLYRLYRKSNQIRCLNDNKDIDRHPHSLDDGSVAYTRWEYQERHFLEVHAVWAMRPDGTMAQPVFKQHLGVPYGLRDTRCVPGSRKLVSIATGHHTFAYGPVVLIDPSRGVNDPAAMQTVTPFSVPQEGPNVKTPVAEGGVPDTLFGKGRGRQTQGPPLVAVSDRFSNAAVTQPGQFGSRQSRVVRVVLDDALHRREAKLSPDEWTALVTWVDANAPYHDTFFNKRPADGGPPRRDVAIEYPLAPGWDRAE